jgi:dTDP-4-dehydrorhamnose 3,5-epimerase-like enzyme
MKPHIIKFSIKENLKQGNLLIAEIGKEIPFDIKRIFWTHNIPDNIIRGNHAHQKTQQVLICLQGSILVNITERDGSKESFHLKEPTKGLYLPPDSWHTMTYSENAIQLVFASELYDEDDYIRDFNNYLNK